MSVCILTTSEDISLSAENFGIDVVENVSCVLTWIRWPTVVSTIVTNLYYFPEYHLFE